MRNLNRLLLTTFLCLWAAPVLAAGGYQMTQLTSNVYAALARPGTPVMSNVLVVIAPDSVIVAGAHFNKQAVDDLVAAVAAITPKPIRYFVLTHHHEGYGSTDFDFPHGKEVLMSWQTWQRLEDEPRFANFSAVFFREGLTLKLGGTTLVLTDLNEGHAPGNLMVYLPEAKVLYTGDLFYAGSVGWMGEAQMQSWILALEFMEQLDVEQIIPGQGPVSRPADLHAYKEFLQAFSTEILRHIAKGDSLKQTLRGFSLPDYEHLKDYERFFKVNVERVYKQLSKMQ